MQKLTGFSVLVVLMSLISSVHAQNFDIFYDPEKTADLRNISPDQAETQAAQDLTEQIEAILKLFSSLSGGGFVHTAEVHSVGGIDVGVRSVFAVVPDEFDDVIPAGELNQFDQGLEDPLQGETAVPFPFLHGSIGLPANFEISGRFFTFPIADQPDGNVTLIGGALKYGLIQNSVLPRVVIIGGYQTLLVPDEFDFGNISVISVKAFASKSLPLFTIYVGGGYDHTSLELDPENFPIELPPELLDHDASVVHGTVGLTFSPLPLLKVNADYNFSEFPNFTLGVGLSFR